LDYLLVQKCVEFSFSEHNAGAWGRLAFDDHGDFLFAPQMALAGVGGPENRHQSATQDHSTHLSHYRNSEHGLAFGGIMVIRRKR
jgi:hypothetical protein